MKQRLEEKVKNKKRQKKKHTKKALVNINMIFNGRNEAIKFMEDYSSTILVTIDREGIKILAPKQMLQRLHIVLAPAKAGHNS